MFFLLSSQSERRLLAAHSVLVRRVGLQQAGHDRHTRRLDRQQRLQPELAPPARLVHIQQLSEHNGPLQDPTGGRRRVALRQGLSPPTASVESTARRRRAKLQNGHGSSSSGSRRDRRDLHARGRLSADHGPRGELSGVVVARVHQRRRAQIHSVSSIARILQLLLQGEHLGNCEIYE